jgi:glycerol-3-phosphate dehydrogenase (NAD(P)+)
MRRQLANAAITLELTDDAIATQVGGAMKNLVAIACGMVTAQRLGENARAAIVTLGLDDMRRLTLALGGRSQTLLGSCGVGDLFLSAASSHSRNTRLGLRLGSAVTGETMDDNPTGTTAELAEGAIAALSVLALEHRLGLRLHVAVCVRDVLLRQSSPAHALAQLLQHSPGQTLPEPKAAAPDWRGGLGFGQVRPGTGAWSQRPSHRGFPSW